MPAPVLVTGATGFVGRSLCRLLVERGIPCRAAIRIPLAAPDLPTPVQSVVTGDIGPATDWSEALTEVEAVVHLAARVHHLKDDQPGLYRQVNTLGTLHLAGQAARAGVRRFVFLSSVKAVGESGHLTPDTPPTPADAYGRSKREAELGLRDLEARTGMEVVILRPPLVYGPGVRANFLRLLRLIDRGVPLPLASVDNRRSLLYVDNLADAILTCLAHPAAAGQTFYVSDGEPLSTPALIRHLAHALGRPARLVPFPPVLLRLAARLLGRGALADRLLGDLTVDDLPLRRTLTWTPPCSIEEGMARTARWYMQPGRPSGPF
ncbi:MAG: SDR family oxidoreductase [Gammaproteobacteria bacterium]|nr:MAG: SDR family oxidoreductase [Gammaproteobacteria bacterium]